MYRQQPSSSKLTSIIGLFIAVFSILSMLATSPIYAAATTCTDSSDCTVRSWLASLQAEASLLDCASVKLQKSITVLNATANANTTDMLTIINKRVVQLNKLKSAIYSLSLEIQAINSTCTKFDGPDCNLTKAATTTTTTTTTPSPFSTAALLSMGDMANSTILNMTQADRFVREIVNGTSSTIALKLIYRGSRDGLSVASFHAKCDNKGATVTLIKSTSGAVFGGYTSLSWRSEASLTANADASAFMFSVISATKEERFVKVLQNANKAYAMYNYVTYGPTFGGGHDMCVKFNTLSYFNPNTYGYGIITNDYYSGGQYFTEAEIEIYTIQ
ncbi:predicted protein [Naegleria gruberi]|uniref:Predicted protein n=1 Tax=Naegleria gruberi TaxID=5762 RepID=D2VZV2_NAEGR|nr:uncharacterized protein NAEGRDRAFT_74628 [Naegleria gruberi]EFC37594.1 predicted protein [Naegleria gruberi]|eukprot:XP_002670338.1 predicted protein [Naegleria gruberi strain NEG-M]